MELNYFVNTDYMTFIFIVVSVACYLDLWAHFVSLPKPKQSSQELVSKNIFLLFGQMLIHLVII